MNKKELLKEIKGVFKPPKNEYYLGKLKFGTPYFYPINFERYILSFRVLKERSKEELKKYEEKFPYLKNSDQSKFSNLPMVRRNKNFIFKLFKKHIYVSMGFPVYVERTDLGWKYKYESVRFEWLPSFQIFFFNWQFCSWLIALDNNSDLYYEMILHYLKNSNKDIKKAKDTWGWVDFKSKESTWNNEYLIK